MDGLITAISVAGTLMGTIFGVYTTMAVNRRQIESQKAEMRRSNLDNTYKKLSRILSLFPYEYPNNILKGSAGYSMEDFDIVLHILDIQLADMRERQERVRIQQRIDNVLDTNIRNHEYMKREITKIRDQYQNAMREFIEFKDNESAIIEMYASQRIRNMLVLFEVTLHNVFISGITFEDNVIDINRERLRDSMRNDLN